MTTRPKTGGRKRGSIDREARRVLTDRMAGDLMTVYGRLGGVDWLLEFAKANPAEFIKSGLSRLWPAPQKDDPDVVNNNQFNFNQNDTLEAARRVAFALNLGIQTQRELAPPPVAERVVPEQPPVKSNWRPAPEPEPLLRPEPVEDLERARWASEIPLTPQERADAALVRETHEAIANYAGSSAEQGLGPAQRQRPAEPRTVSELHQRMRSRREELL